LEVELLVLVKWLVPDIVAGIDYGQAITLFAKTIKLGSKLFPI